MNENLRLSEIDRHTGPAVNAARLPTNTTTKNHAVHRWFNFIAGFSPELVAACIDMESANTEGSLTLLDPFSGCGTAPLQARLEGVKSIGYEAHPFFAFISEAKANSHIYWGDLNAVATTIQAGLTKRVEAEKFLSKSAFKFLQSMFDQDHLSSLCSARRELEVNGLVRHPLAILMLSRILDHSCFAATDGIYKAPTSTKNAMEPTDAFTRVYSLMLADSREALIGASKAEIVAGTSQRMFAVANNSIDLVVTSPPYLNNFDFAEMTRMYLYFWKIAESWGEITDVVRSRLVVNTTTALKGHKNRQQHYREALPRTVRSEADDIVNELAELRSKRAGKKEYDFLIYPYLKQMRDVLFETRRCLRPGAPMHMMVSDAALYGVHVPAPQWLGQIMDELGYKDISCELVRPRGHRWILDKRAGSAKGLGEYYLYGRS